MLVPQSGAVQLGKLYQRVDCTEPLLRLRVRTLGETPRWSKDQLLGQIRHRAQHTDGTLLVLLDEAHLLKAETLTDLR